MRVIRMTRLSESYNPNLKTTYQISPQRLSIKRKKLFI